MSLRAARALVAGYFVVMLLAVVWPGAVPASRIEPMVLGLPFSFFWPGMWVAFSVPVLWALDRVEGRHRKGGPAMPQLPGLEVHPGGRVLEEEERPPEGGTGPGGMR